MENQDTQILKILIGSMSLLIVFLLFCIKYKQSKNGRFGNKY